MPTYTITLISSPFDRCDDPTCSGINYTTMYAQTPPFATLSDPVPPDFIALSDVLFDFPESVIGCYCSSTQFPATNETSIVAVLKINDAHAALWASGWTMHIAMNYDDHTRPGVAYNYVSDSPPPPMPPGPYPRPCPASTVVQPGADMSGNLSAPSECVNGVCECPVNCVPTPGIGNGYGSPPGSGGNGGHPSVPLMIR